MRLRDALTQDGISQVRRLGDQALSPSSKATQEDSPTPSGPDPTFRDDGPGRVAKLSRRGGFVLDDHRRRMPAMPNAVQSAQRGEP